MIGLLKKVIVNLPIRLKGNSKRASGKSLGSLVTQNKDLGAALQTLLAEVYVYDAGLGHNWSKKE